LQAFFEQFSINNIKSGKHQQHQNSQELATATQIEKKRDDDIGAKKSIPQNK
jgi:hypothetical protein